MAVLKYDIYRQVHIHNKKKNTKESITINSAVKQKNTATQRKNRVTQRIVQ
jgi:hypothetical protein